MYFGSDQSREFSPVSAMKSDEVTPMPLRSSHSEKPHRKTHPRVHMVNRWTEGVISERNAAKDDNGFHLNLCDVDQYVDDNITAPRDSDMRSAKEYSPRGIYFFYLFRYKFSIESFYKIFKIYFSSRSDFSIYFVLHILCS